MSLSKKKCEAFHREVSDDLQSLARLAQRLDLFRWWSDLDTISATLSKCDTPRWRYTLNDAAFDLPPSAVSWPASPAAVTCWLSLEVEGSLELNASLNKVVPVLTHWQANLKFEAVDGSGDTWSQFWHFDRHLGGNPPPELHPLYHANFGGGKMESYRASNPTVFAGNLFKGMVEMPAPRLHLAPMDIILFVDFVIANFDGVKWRLIRGDPAYVDLIARAQEKYWRAYFSTLSDFFLKPAVERHAHEARALWPNLAVPA